MKRAHTIIMNVFVKPEELLQDKEINNKIIDCIKKMLTVDWTRESDILNTTTAEGFDNRKIQIHELHMHKESHTNQFINNLMNHFTSEQKQFLITDKHNRLDENLEFFIRLDKKRMLEGKYELTTSGDCFHIKMNIAAFPKKIETALAVIDSMLKQ